MVEELQEKGLERKEIDGREQWCHVNIDCGLFDSSKGHETTLRMYVFFAFDVFLQKKDNQNLRKLY
eukprot:gene9810-6886_t